MQIVEKIRNFVCENLAVEEDVVFGDDDNFFELGFVDSSFAIQLVCFIEEEFEIEVTDEDLDIANFSSVNRIVSFVERKKAI